MNPTVQENFVLCKLDEGMTPDEYNGLEISADPFCETDQYGMWVRLYEKATNQRMIDMFNAMLVFIPQTHMQHVQVLHSFGLDEKEKTFQTIGWKYAMAMQPKRKTVKLQTGYLTKAQIELSKDPDDMGEDVLQLAIQLQEAANAD